MRKDRGGAVECGSRGVEARCRCEGQSQCLVRKERVEGTHLRLEIWVEKVLLNFAGSRRSEAGFEDDLMTKMGTKK